MIELPRMSEACFRRAKKLIRKLCANCDGGNCLLLDDGEICVCPQLISYTVLCRYFRAAVLPADRELYTEVIEADKRKRCPDCGQAFLSAHHNTIYCAVCAAKRTRQKKRAWAQRNKG
ncbi:MAG: cysteine-rich VLP domain-containing protein [Oscillospiraceae bacterium]|nr:cysteine-rich VLP domain-containing protein [Oscillospiraceae bacterium]